MKTKQNAASKPSPHSAQPAQLQVATQRRVGVFIIVIVCVAGFFSVSTNLNLSFPQTALIKRCSSQLLTCLSRLILPIRAP